MIRKLLNRQLEIAMKEKLEAGDATELESLHRQINRWEKNNPNTEYKSEYGIVWKPQSAYTSKGTYKGFVVYQYRIENKWQALWLQYHLRADSEKELVQKINELIEDL